MGTKKTSRRKFLQDSGQSALMLTAMNTVLSSLISSRAWADTTQFKKFLHINFYLSPPRWMYDMFLNPGNSSDNFLSSPMISNAFTGTDRYTGVKYKLIKHGNTWVPYLWSLNVPTSSGSVKASNLLNNMISIRGINVMNAGHIGANELHQSPVPGAPTITSLTSDRASSDPINPAFNLIRAMSVSPCPGTIFRSRQGYQAYLYSLVSGNNFTQLFNSFGNEGYTSAFLLNRAKLQQKMTAAVDSMQPGASHYYGSVIDSSKRSIKILTDQSIAVFSDLDTKWTEIFTRYQGLITQVLNGAMSGAYPMLTDKPVGRVPLNAEDQRMYQVGEGIFVQTGEPNVDLRLMFQNTKADALAAQFAITEFLLTRNISPSVSMVPSAFSGVNVNGKNQGWYFDQHNISCIPGLLGNSLYYLGFTACLLELIAKLKAANMFNDTLIYMAPEFGRSARVDGSGSDHGAAAGCVSLISGRIEALKVIGNIYRDSAGVGSSLNSTYRGTWGLGAPINGEVLSIIQVWGSVMNLLGLPLPEIPNIVKKDKLIFNTAGSFGVAPGFNLAPQNIFNPSKS